MPAEKQPETNSTQAPELPKIGFWKSLLFSYIFAMGLFAGMKFLNYLMGDIFSLKALGIVTAGFFLIVFPTMWLGVKYDDLPGMGEVPGSNPRKPTSFTSVMFAPLRWIWACLIVILKAAFWFLKALDGGGIAKGTGKGKKRSTFMRNGSIGGIHFRYNGSFPVQYKSGGGVRYYQSDGDLEIFYPDAKSSKEYLFKGRTLVVKIK